MDCNMSPLQSDWENLIMFGASQTETHEKQLPMEWEIQKCEGIESMVPSLSGFDGGSSDSVSNFWFNALSMGSQSTSVSSSPLDVKSSKLTSYNHEGFLGDFSSNLKSLQTKASPAFEAYVQSAEPLLGLKLGKRTYFEDDFGGNNDSSSDILTNLKTSGPSKKFKSDGQSKQITRCRVEGCNRDLSTAKEYHRKHRVCVSHSKCSKVIVGGVERRFCQQCSRFHGLSEFDGKKRSCRKRLSDHNARRRKPRPGIFPLNPPRIYDEKQHPGFVWNGLSLHMGAEDKFPWQDTCSRLPTQTEGFTLSFPKAKGIKEQLLPNSSSQPHNSITEHQNHSRFLPGKTNFISFQVPTKGEEFLASSGLDETHSFDRALSLLSTTSQDSCYPKHGSLNHLTNNHEPPSTQPMSEAFPTRYI